MNFDRLAIIATVVTFALAGLSATRWLVIPAALITAVVVLAAAHQQWERTR